ncbi:MAG: thiamine pyrophosphate-binding protein [Saonia sp.]
MNYSSIPSAQSLVFQCKAKGIRNIVISPGSRNAPLTIGFSEDPFFRCFSIVDERCAGFFALGIAQQLREPVVILCTSGSALLNYYPAVAEAFYSDIPLVVISADRPNYKIDIGDGQTIRQDHVFERHIGYSANLKQDISHATETIRELAKELIDETISIDANQMAVQSYNDSELYKALKKAIEALTPVHINVPFEEPLYNKVEQATVTPFIVSEELEQEEKEIDLKHFADIWNSSKKKMVMIGVNHPDTVEQQFLDEIAEDTSVIVFTETTSNIHHPNFFSSIDSIIAPIEKSKERHAAFKELQPDILLTFGGLIVSKKIKAFLRQYKPKHHWHVDSKKAYNTFFSLSQHLKIDINAFFDGFLHLVTAVESNYRTHWTLVKTDYEIKREEYIAQIPFSDMLVFHHILRKIPLNFQLQLANSSTVRYAQLFAMDPSLKVFCNRGTSGIDGSTSTAVGASIYHIHPTLLITGDLSFFYDSNGLWNNYMRPDFRIILINNNGGGIFRILPGHEDTWNFETYFETNHTFEASQLCKMNKIEYHSVSDEKALKESLKTFYQKSKTPKLLEVKTPRLLNNKILLSYFDFIS